MFIISKKLCLLGEIAVGKTSLVRRYVDRQFSERYLSTIGVKISRQTINLKKINHYEQSGLQFVIWDIEGQIKFNYLTPNYLQGASAAIVVADITRYSTIERLSEYIQLFLSINPQGKIAIALNKSDLVKQKEATKIIEEVVIKNHPQIMGIYPTSAKTSTNVDEMFKKVGEQLINFDNQCY